MKTAVIAMAYGSPSSIEDVPAYLQDVRGGRPARREAVEELAERYRRIGGVSPLNERTEAQRAALERELGMPVYVGMKHWQPRIADAVQAGGRRRRRADRRPRPRAALLADVDRRVPPSGSRAA